MGNMEAEAKNSLSLAALHLVRYAARAEFLWRGGRKIASPPGAYYDPDKKKNLDEPFYFSLIFSKA